MASRGLLVLGAVVAGTGVLVALFWRATWFGTRLDDEALLGHLAPDARARDVQHAVEEIAQRFRERRPGMDRWAAALVEASRRPEPVVRGACAWAMQEDAGRPEFLARLREVVAADPSEIVRRNAATSLARGRDPAARAVLLAMLEPFPVTAPVSGTLTELLGRDHVVREGARVGRIAAAGGTEADVLAPVPGRVVEHRAAPGAPVAAGAAILVLAPDPAHALNAVTGLALVGTSEDLGVLARVAAPDSVFPDEVKTQARAAVAAIRAR